MRTNGHRVVHPSTENTGRNVPSYYTPPPPLIPSLAYDPRLGDGEPEITTLGHGDCGLEHLATTNAPSAFLSEDEFAWLVRHHNIHGRFRFLLTFFISAHI